MTRFTLVLVGLALFVASLLAVMGYTPRNPAETLAEGQDLFACRVLEIYDGDTLGCDLDGSGKIDHQDEKVRLLGIEAPEMHYSRKNTTGKNEPFAAEAKALVKQSTLRRTVYLEFDQHRYDKYDRTLAYVYLDPEAKTMLNRMLLEQGLATVLFIGVNRRYEPDFIQIQQAARGKGLHQ
jgi:micrococcal nuclease